MEEKGQILQRSCEERDVTPLGFQDVFKEVMFELGSEGRGKGDRKKDGKNTPGQGAATHRKVV